MEASQPSNRIQCKSIWLSDIHLGSRYCKANELLQLLEIIEFETLYLVGDIIDLLAMKRRVHWPSSHNKVLRKLMKLSRREGCMVIYVPGNHDYPFRTLVGSALGDIEIKRSVKHLTAKGQSMLVIHGDELDHAVRYSKLIRVFGDLTYEFLMGVNHSVVILRRLLGLRYWSLARWTKENVSRANSAITAYQDAAINTARMRGYDGIICGHLHYPCLLVKEGIQYCNDGDWVENCSALIEDANGEFALIRGISSPNSVDKMIFVDAGTGVEPHCETIVI